MGVKQLCLGVVQKDGDHPRGEKRKAEEQDVDSDPEPEDEVM